MTCDQVREQLAELSAWGADSAERVPLDAHLAACAGCRAEAAVWADVAAQAMTAVDPVRPPAALRARVMESAATPEVRPSVAKPPSTWIRFGAIVGPLAAAMTLGVLVGTLSRLRDAETRLGELEAGLSREQELTAFLKDPRVRQAVLAAAEGSSGEAKVFYHSAEGRVVFYGYDLPKPAADRGYQVWLLIPGDPKPHSVGMVELGADGRGVLRASAGAPSQAKLTFAVTDEPAAGSPAPTTKPFLVGETGRL